MTRTLDVLDDARREPEVDDVADSDLVFGDDEDAVQHVLDDVLRAEAESGADRGGEQGERARAFGASTMTMSSSATMTIETLTMFCRIDAERAGALDEADRGERRALQRLRVVDVGLVLGARDDPRDDPADDELQDPAEDERAER